MFHDNLSEEQIANILKWIEMLRSEKYKQSKGMLNRNGFCCLGVAGDWLTKQYHDVFRWERNTTGFYVLTHGENYKNSSYLSGQAVNYFGLKEGVGKLSHAGIDFAKSKFNFDIKIENLALVNLNDELDATFPQIADIIEYELSLVTS